MPIHAEWKLELIDGVLGNIQTIDYKLFNLPNSLDNNTYLEALNSLLEFIKYKII